MDVNPDALAGLAYDLAAGAAAPPGTLRARVLGSIGDGRAAMHPAWNRDADSPASEAFLGFTRTAAELAALLADLEPAEWLAETTTPAGSVRALVAHIVGVERYALGQLGRRSPLPAPTRADHVPVSRLAAGDTGGLSTEELARTWWVDVLDVTRTCGELGPEAPVTFHHLGLTVRGLLVVRIFELWSHGDDIRRATARDLDRLDADRLSLLSRGLVAAIGLGMSMSGTARPGRTARLVLTGPGGGSYDVALEPGGTVGRPDASITVSTLDLCRIASRRLRTGDARIRVAGDHTLLEPLLVGAQAFAAD